MKKERRKQKSKGKGEREREREASNGMLQMRESKDERVGR